MNCKNSESKALSYLSVTGITAALSGQTDASIALCVLAQLVSELRLLLAIGTVVEGDICITQPFRLQLLIGAIQK